jgi:DNA-binding NarL/FixJ family response regulator
VPPLEPPPERVRVLLADDDPLYAEWLMGILSEDSRIDVIGIAANGVEAVALTSSLRPDVVVMDLNMPILDGVEATRRLRKLGLATQVMFLTGTESAIDPAAAMEAGASAFLRKEETVDELRKVFFEVASLGAVLAHGFTTPR